MFWNKKEKEAESIANELINNGLDSTIKKQIGEIITKKLIEDFKVDNTY